MDPTTAACGPQMPSPTTLSNPSTPWMMSPGVFQRVQSVQTNDSYKKCEITSNDPEWAFIQTYFTSHSPVNRHIGRVYCIHNGASTRQFEALIPSLEEEAKQSAFTPKWRDEEDFALRQKVNDRWNGMTAPYSPFVVQGSNPRKYSNVKILPLWHGTTAAICDSVCKTGFTSFGKHALKQGEVSPGQNTDIGYFGSGIYFTNSARYAADIYSDGNLLLAWVSMREPYPVAANCTYPNKPGDMKNLEGNSHYQNYNAHYIPVISVNPANKKCAIYYPCTANQEPDLDEIVVFQKGQALTRFWIELEVTLAASPFPSIETMGTLLDKVLELLDHPEVKQNPELSNLLKTKSDVLFSINESIPLDLENLTFYQKIKRLMDSTGKIRSMVAQQLMIPQIVNSPPLQKNQPAIVQAPSFSILSHVTPLQKPAIAFGAEKWNKYFGNIGIEPPLPPNIENILNSPCLFWPGKKVKDTHLLFLVPATVDGNPLTLNFLQELIQKPKEGYKTKYYAYHSYVKNELGNQSASPHWVLMTRDVIPNSRNLAYKDQKKLVAAFAQQSDQPYELPKALEAVIGIVTEHVQTETKLYRESPWTFTRCQDKVERNQWPVAIGGFHAAGLGVFDDNRWAPSGAEGVGVCRSFWVLESS